MQVLLELGRLLLADALEAGARRAGDVVDRLRRSEPQGFFPTTPAAGGLVPAPAREMIAEPVWYAGSTTQAEASKALEGSLEARRREIAAGRKWAAR